MHIRNGSRGSARSGLGRYYRLEITALPPHTIRCGITEEAVCRNVLTMIISLGLGCAHLELVYVRVSTRLYHGHSLPNRGGVAAANLDSDEL